MSANRNAESATLDQSATSEFCYHHNNADLAYGVAKPTDADVKWRS